MKKIRLLIASECLDQAGSERWVYEICKHINKERFEIAVLTRKRADGDSGGTFRSYYYKKLQEIGTPIIPLIGDDGRSLPRRAVDRVLRTLENAVGIHTGYTNPKIVDLFDHFDIVCVVDFYNYVFLKNELNLARKDFFVALHCHKFQFSHDIYHAFDRKGRYNFAYFCPKQVDDLVSSGIDLTRSTLHYNPLVMDLSQLPHLYNPIEDEAVFSIFTRVARMKPIGNFIEAYAKLRSRLECPSKLYIYGTIVDPEYQDELLKLAAELNIGPDKIVFKGHTTDIAKTLRDDRVNVYWGLSIDTSVGYSSIEIGAMGVPGFYWNLDPSTDPHFVERKTNGSMISHNRVDDFVNAHLGYFDGTGELAELSAKQRKYFFETNDISGQIRIFEDYVASLSSPATKGLRISP